MKNRWNRLPDIVVTGVKKCGTKALLTFLLAHPMITGTHGEYYYGPCSIRKFECNLAAFFGQIRIPGWVSDYN